MRIQTLLLSSHLTSALLGATAMILAWRSVASPTIQTVTIGAAASLVVVVSWLISAKLRRGLRVMIRTTAKADGSNMMSAGIVEFDGMARQLSEYVQRCSEAAAGARQQAHDIETLLVQLDRRSARKESRSSSAGSQLRHVLDGITRTVDAELHQVVNCIQEISQSAATIADGADDQSDSVTKATTYVEQLSTNIDLVKKNSRNIQEDVATIRDSAKESTACVTDLTRGVERLKGHLEANERNFRSLTDHAREIGSMIETISGIASRTDMLALNASIESVRAGEHGKGFAIVAEEVHRLAEQTAHATREVAGMLDSTQLETREALRGIGVERQKIEREMARVQSVQDVFDRIIELSNDSVDGLGEIPNSTEQQLLVTKEVLLAVERIANIAKSTRSQAEKVRWTTTALSKMASQFDSALMPLRGCASEISQRATQTPAGALAETLVDRRGRDQDSTLDESAQEIDQGELEIAAAR